MKEQKKNKKPKNGFKSKSKNSLRKKDYSPKPKEREKPKHLQKPKPISEADFSKQVKKLGLTLSPHETKALIHYLDSLMLWNTRINLVGTLEWKQTLAELIIDSYYLKDFIKSLDIPTSSPICWDLGSGAGLPGIPLRIFWHEGEYTLVEAREKRALFMTNFLLKEENASAKVFWGRAENFFEKEEKDNKLADMILSRAFMPYQELMKFVSPYIKKGGLMLLMLNEDLKNFTCEDNSWVKEKTIKYEIVLETNNKQTRYFHALRKV